MTPATTDLADLRPGCDLEAGGNGREIASLDPASMEHQSLIDEWTRLRVEYQRLFDLARQHHRPEPPPWPEPEFEASRP